MNNKHYKTLEILLADQAPSNVKWQDIENLLTYLGAKIQEGKGSRVRVALNGVKAVFHEPHPTGKEVSKCLKKDIKKFLETAEIDL